MPDAQPRRLASHLRRNLVAYVALVGMVAFSPVPGVAADLVTTDEIANGAVTRPKLARDSVVTGKILNGSIVGADIKDHSVGSADLAPSAKGARVISYDLGYRNFSNFPSLDRRLPGTWDAAVVGGSQWSATMHDAFSGRSVVVPGTSPDGENYKLFVSDDGVVHIWPDGAGGEVYDSIRLYRTLPTSTSPTSIWPP